MADQQNPTRLTPAIFLDRDGVLNVDAGYTHKVEDLVLYPDVVPTLRALQDSGYKLIVISNQSGVGRGMFTDADVDRFHATMQRLLADQGVRIEAFYYCPHHPGEGCECRKPKTALVDQAIVEHGVHRAMSWFVGDKDSDVECGLNAGLQPVFVNRKTDDAHGRALTVTELSQLPDLIVKKKSRYAEGLTALFLLVIHAMVSWPKPVNATVTLGIALILMWHAPQWGLPRLYQFRSWLWWSRSNIPWRTIGMGALAVLFSAAATDLLILPWQIWYPEEILAMVESFESLNNPAGFLMVSLHAPIVEEILFRGVLLLWLMRRMSVIPALLISSFIFGAMHGPGALSGIIFGLAAGLTYLQTGSLVPVIVLHILNNTCAVIYTYGAEPLTLADLQQIHWQDYWPNVVLMLISLPGIVWMWRVLRAYRGATFRSSSSLPARP